MSVIVIFDSHRDFIFYVSVLSNIKEKFIQDFIILTHNIVANSASERTWCQFLCLSCLCFTNIEISICTVCSFLDLSIDLWRANNYKYMLNVTNQTKILEFLEGKDTILRLSW